jgi:hypothetical protein
MSPTHSDSGRSFSAHLDPSTSPRVRRRNRSAYVVVAHKADTAPHFMHKALSVLAVDVGADELRIKGVG